MNMNNKIKRIVKPKIKLSLTINICLVGKVPYKILLKTSRMFGETLTIKIKGLKVLNKTLIKFFKIYKRKI